MSTFAGVLVPLRDRLRFPLLLRVPEPRCDRGLQTVPFGGLTVHLHDDRAVVVYGEQQSGYHHSLLCRQTHPYDNPLNRQTCIEPSYLPKPGLGWRSSRPHACIQCSGTCASNAVTAAISL